MEVFPRDIAPCGGEEKVKAYHCSCLRSKFTGRSLAEGVLTITNQRVIYRTVCYGSDKNFAHSELPIEDVAGVSLQKGRYFDSFVFFFNYFLINLIVVAPAVAFGLVIEKRLSWMILVWLLVWTVVLIGLFAAFQALRGALPRIIAANGSLQRYVLDAAKYILWPMKNQLTLTIASRGHARGPIHVKLARRFGQIDLSADVAPLPGAAALTREIGTVINNIQHGVSPAAEPQAAFYTPVQQEPVPQAPIPQAPLPQAPFPQMSVPQIALPQTYAGYPQEAAPQYQYSPQDYAYGQGGAYPAYPDASGGYGW